VIGCVWRPFYQFHLSEKARIEINLLPSSGPIPCSDPCSDWGSMRIVAGQWKGQRLQAPAGNATRPTTDRVREALFSILGHEIQQSSVLDLFAGTGALGLEALSRGAKHAVFVEQRRETVSCLVSNIDRLGAQSTTKVIAKPVDRCWPELQVFQPYSVVFLDPPYRLVADGTIGKIIAKIVSSQIMVEDGLCVLEHASQDAPPEHTELQCVTRKYGDCSLSFYSFLPHEIEEGDPR
jgi:16S rRNA (guanine966-N2)-methyltransferase